MKLAIAAALGCAAILCGCNAHSPSGRQASAVAGAQDAKLSDLERAVVERINQIRREHDLDALEVNATLVELARQHSRYMRKQREITHKRSGDMTLSKQVKQAGLDYRKIAENVGGNVGYEDPVPRTVKGWMDSQGHRKNILDGAFTQTGVGVVRDEETGAYYLTQIFYLPMPDLF